MLNRVTRLVNDPFCQILCTKKEKDVAFKEYKRKKSTLRLILRIMAIVTHSLGLYVCMFKRGFVSALLVCVSRS